MSTDGSGLRQITSGAIDTGPAGWSKDGEWVIFLRNNRTFYAIRKDGTDQQLLYDAGVDVPTFAWKPN